MFDCYDVRSVSLTTASGTGTATTDQPISGRILQIEYDESGTAPLSDNATFTVTAVRADGSEIEIYSSVAGDIDDSNVFLPEFPTRDQDGALTGNGDAYLLVGERLRFDVADGGDAKVATFRVKVAR